MKAKSLLSFIIATLLFAACQPADKAISASGFYFDTIIKVTIYDDTRQDALDGCLALAEQFESCFSDTLPDSDVSEINSHPYEPVKVHPETAELIIKALSYGESSSGRFDITIGRLSDLWDFTEAKDIPALPDPDKIDKALSHVDYRNVTVDGDTVTLKDDGCAIDLGGIAKGYIADKMKEYLINEGIDSALINLGGNVLAIGERPGKGTYTIGIQKPFSDDGSPIASVDITDMSVVTSGTYQRYFTFDGKQYHHILDPSTGYPCENGLSSVTIITGSSTDADALSTTVFLMGAKEGLAYVESLDDTEAIFVTTDNELIHTSGIGKGIPFKEYP